MKGMRYNTAMTTIDITKHIMLINGTPNTTGTLVIVNPNDIQIYNTSI